MQRGDGEYLPHVLVPRGRNKAKLPGNFSVEFVQYVPSLHAHMEAADLIISHAGSGSLFEALSLHKAVIAVPNSSLMANHQVTTLQHALLCLRIAEFCHSSRAPSIGLKRHSLHVWTSRLHILVGTSLLCFWPGPSPGRGTAAAA